MLQRADGGREGAGKGAGLGADRVDVTRSGANEANGLFNAKVVQRLLKEHLRGDFDHEWKLWAILSVVAWDEFFLRPQPSP